MVSTRLHGIFARRRRTRINWNLAELDWSYALQIQIFFIRQNFHPVWSLRASRAYPVTSQPFSCPYQDSVHIEFWMFCVDYVSFLFVSFRIPKQWGGTSVWPSCLNGFLTNPGQSWDCAVWSNQSAVQWWMKCHTKAFWFYWPLCLKMTHFFATF